MAAALFLIFLLVASGGVAVGDDGARLPHLELRGLPYSSREYVPDAPPPQGLVDHRNFTHGCARFTALVARTTNAREIFRDHVVAGGLTVFCPNDVAVAAFEPKFGNLSAEDQLSVLLHHGAAARYWREQIAAFESVEVRTLAANEATNKSLTLTVRDDGDTVSLWPSSGSGGAAARVTRAIPLDDSPLAVYVVDAVLLPSHLRQLLDGAALCTPCGGGGYLGWLHCPMSVRPVGLLWAVSAMVCILSGFFVTDYHRSRRQNEAIRRVTQAISSDDSPLAIDADDVELLPSHLRLLLDVYLRVRAECL